MSYLNYVIAGYAVFVLVLGWEFFASRLQIRRELRQARRRAARQSSTPGMAAALARSPEHPFDGTPGRAPNSPPDTTPRNPPPAPNELIR